MKPFSVNTTVTHESSVNHNNKLLVPSFIRLFFIRRIISNTDNHDPPTIPDLVNEYMSGEAASGKLHARNILLLLKTKGNN